VPPVFRASLGLRMTDMRPVPEEAQFKGVNVLGSDFCLLHGAVANLNYDTKEVKLTFRVKPAAKGP
jgi:Cu/Ag efflux protein CusF